MPPPVPPLPADYRIDYAGHDVAYRRKQAAGLPGWDPSSVTQDGIRDFETYAGLSTPPHAGAVLLELGCGAGNLALTWASKGWRVIGIDVAPFAIQWAQRKADEQNLQAQFFLADLTRPLTLPIPPADWIVDGHCLHCIIGPDDRRMFFCNVMQLLKPGGTFVVHTMCGDPRKVPGRFDPRSRCQIVNGNLAVRYFGRPDDILQEIAEAGFHIASHVHLPAQDDQDQDSLLVRAAKPSNGRCRARATWL